MRLLLPRVFPVVFLTAALVLVSTGCAGPAKRPLVPLANSPMGQSDVAAKPAIVENRTTQTVEPIRLQSGRYSVVTARPSAEQLNPLLVVVDVRIPRDLFTVKDAAAYLLQRSGYRLASPDEHSPRAQVLLLQTIPEVQRHLGPMTLQDALLTLGGPAFRLQVDAVNRVVAYELSPDHSVGGG